MRKIIILFVMIFLVGCTLEEKSWEIRSSDELKALYPSYLEIGAGWEIGEIIGAGSLSEGFLLGAMQDYDREKDEINVFVSLFESSETAKAVCENKFKWEGEKMEELPKGCSGSLNGLGVIESVGFEETELVRICCVRELVVVEVKADGAGIGEEAKRFLELMGIGCDFRSHIVP